VGVLIVLVIIVGAVLIVRRKRRRATGEDVVGRLTPQYTRDPLAARFAPRKRGRR
jgi:hypothetical protein